jgi:hypothetical protein
MFTAFARFYCHNRMQYTTSRVQYCMPATQHVGGLRQLADQDAAGLAEHRPARQLWHLVGLRIYDQLADDTLNNSGGVSGCCRDIHMPFERLQLVTAVLVLAPHVKRPPELRCESHIMCELRAAYALCRSTWCSPTAAKVPRTPATVLRVASHLENPIRRCNGPPV